MLDDLYLNDSGREGNSASVLREDFEKPQRWQPVRQVTVAQWSGQYRKVRAAGKGRQGVGESKTPLALGN